VTSEQGNPPEKGEGSEDQNAAGPVPETDAQATPGPVTADDTAGAAPESPAADEGAAETAPRAEETAPAETPAAPAAEAAPEPPAPAEAAPEPPAPAAPEAPAAPSIDEGATEAMPTSALADAEIPAAPAADAPAPAPEPEAPQAAPEAPSVDDGATQAIPTSGSISIDIPAAPAADNAPEQIAPATPEPPAAQATPSAPQFDRPQSDSPQSGGAQFDDDGTQILRLGPSQPSSPAAPPAPAADPYEERTQVLPPQGASGFNAPAPYGEQAAQSPASAWPSPPPNPLADPNAAQQAPAPAPAPSPYQQPNAMQPPPPANPYAQPQSAYQAPPPAAPQPSAQSDDTQKLIIGAHNPYSEPPPAMGSGYDPNQSQPQAGPYSQPGMPPGSVPPGQFATPPPQSGGSKNKVMIPILAIVGVLVLAGAAVAVWFLVLAPPTFEEGGCVRHTSGDQAEAIECADATNGEDYEIVQKVSDGQECADAGRETLTVGEDVYCLSLLGAPAEGEGGGEPTDEAS
jgi:hypothetical protein